VRKLLALGWGGTQATGKIRDQGLETIRAWLILEPHTIRQVLAHAPAMTGGCKDAGNQAKERLRFQGSVARAVTRSRLD
jgi:hypothetical protein